MCLLICVEESKYACKRNVERCLTILKCRGIVKVQKKSYPIRNLYAYMV